MKSFEEIMDNLDTLVYEGKLSEESASNIANSFYDRYVTEANAYNKAADIYNKKVVGEINKGNELADKSKYKDENDPMQQHLINAALKKYRKADDTAKKLGMTSTRYVSNNTPIKKGEYSNDDYRFANRNYTANKKEWMRNHGNAGVSPEEKYKAGRYLKVQQMEKESSLEDEINGLGIACEAGLISEDFLPILLEAVDSYLD